MNNLTLQQMEKLGISKWMNEKEREKAIEKAIEEQKELIANNSHKEEFDFFLLIYIFIFVSLSNKAF